MKCRNCKHNVLIDDNGEQYNWCGIACDNLNIDEERECAAYAPAINADRIRAMRDEELAAVLANTCVPDRPRCYLPSKGESIEETCTRCCLDWLREEVSE